MTPTGVQILGVSPTGVLKLGMTGVKNPGVSSRCAKIGHDRCEKTVHDVNRCTNIGRITDRCEKIGHDRCEKSGCE